MNLKLVDIVIVNWNTGDLLEKCVDSVFRSSYEHIGKVIIVDNASSDNSLRFLSKDNDQLHIIMENSNNGFGKACNIGAKKTNSKYILFLNPDTEINKNCYRVYGIRKL